MALGSAGLTGTGGSHDKYVPEIWSASIQAAFEVQTKTKPHTLDLSSLLSAQGGDVLRVPKIANRAATTRTLTTMSQITPVGATEGEFSMNVQTWAIDPEFVSDALTAQTKLFKFSQIDGKMRNSLAVKFDTDLLANYSSITASLGDNTGGTNLGPDDLFDAVEQLHTNNIDDLGNMVFILTPKTYTAMLKNSTITSQDWVDEKSKVTGRVPMIGGVKVVMSNNLPTHANGGKANLLLHKECLAFAIAQPARVRTEENLDYLGTTIVGDMIYGSGCYRAEAGVVLYGK
jgi:hypothetical protein